MYMWACVGKCIHVLIVSSAEGTNYAPTSDNIIIINLCHTCIQNYAVDTSTKVMVCVIIIIRQRVIDGTYRAKLAGSRHIAVVSQMMPVST